jgi:hypothetical protein
MKRRARPGTERAQGFVPRSAAERHDPADSGADRAHGHDSDQALGRRALAIFAEPADVRGVADRDHRHAVLPRARHRPLEGEHGRVLAEPAVGVDQGRDRALPRNDRPRRRDDETAIRVAHVLRHPDDPVGVVTGEIRAYQVPRELRGHVGVRAHAPGDGGDELAEGIGRAEHRGLRIGHRAWPPFGV